jgi:hypothetical protein
MCEEMEEEERDRLSFIDRTKHHKFRRNQVVGTLGNIDKSSIGKDIRATCASGSSGTCVY